MSRIAYVDSSCIVAIALGEPSAHTFARKLATFDTAVSHPLLDAEVRSACRREDVPVPQREIDLLELIEANRAISSEIDKVLTAGYVRGADCLHLATALYLSPDPQELWFLTLDARQRVVAQTIGFRT